MNNRNHRKIVIIDGKIGYVGGFNVGDEYLGKSKKFGYWRDTHLRIVGDAVNALQLRFILDWNSQSTRDNLTYQERYFLMLILEEQSAFKSLLVDLMKIGNKSNTVT